MIAWLRRRLWFFFDIGRADHYWKDHFAVFFGDLPPSAQLEAIMWLVRHGDISQRLALELINSPAKAAE